MSIQAAGTDTGISTGSDAGIAAGPSVFPDVVVDPMGEAEWAVVVAGIVAGGPGDDPLLGLLGLLATDPASLPAGDAVAYLQATERALAWVQSLQAQALVAIAGPRTRLVEHPVPGGLVVPVPAASLFMSPTLPGGCDRHDEKIVGGAALSGSGSGSD